MTQKSDFSPNDMINILNLILIIFWSIHIFIQS